MDPNVNTGPVNPEPNPPSKPHDIAQPGPIDPATGQPDHGVEVTELKSWFRENAVSMVVTVGVVAAVCIWLDPIDTLKVVLGLGFIIFIHELGHFVAAKWCDVHVKTFSIGFGPAVPFCSYKWGETTYMIGIIPLGGYVAMVGENEGAEGEDEGEEDPRSFRKKSVGQRMVIISAGVIMNIIFGMGCFVAAYLHGVQEKPATVGYVEGGGGAWRAGMRTGDHIVNIDGRQNPYFDDLRPIVMSSSKDEQVPIEWDRKEPNGNVQHFSDTVAPIRDDGQRFPQIGIGPPSQLTLISGNKRKVKPYYSGTPAADATSADGQKFEPGDRIIKMTDPKNPKGEPTPVADYDEYYKRMVLFAKDDITFVVQRQRKDDGSGKEPETVAIVVKPAYRHDLGMRMQMGKVAALHEEGRQRRQSRRDRGRGGAAIDTRRPHQGRHAAGEGRQAPVVRGRASGLEQEGVPVAGCESRGTEETGGGGTPRPAALAAPVKRVGQGQDREVPGTPGRDASRAPHRRGRPVGGWSSTRRSGSITKPCSSRTARNR